MRSSTSTFGRHLGGTVGAVTAARYRCTACGNLTRFDVTATRRTRSFHHYTVGGELTVEGTEVLEELVEEVSCRWCGSARAVEPIASRSDGVTGEGSPA